MKENFLIIGDETGRRVETFINCLKVKDIHKYNVLTWQNIIYKPSVIKDYLLENTIIKIEPPEKDMNLYKNFLKVGSDKGVLTNKNIDSIDFTKFPIVAPSQWYEGIKKVLLNINSEIQNSKKSMLSINNIKESLIMMDKVKTYEALEKSIDYNKDFHLPKKLKSYKSYREFKSETEDQFIKCFIKQRYGSGSEGVIAYTNNPRLKEEKIYTSLNYSNSDKMFYSGYKVNITTDKNLIKSLVNWVLNNDAHIEMWIPKPKYEDYVYDTRSIVIDKKVEYLLSRLSKTPITNLHLKNERKESEDFLDEMNIKGIEKASEAVMNVFNKSFLSGIDVVTGKNGKEYIIDVNPFGDLLHHLIDTDKNIYYKEIDKSIEKLKSRL